MSAYDRVYNFSAGPGVLPVPVLEQAREDILNWQGSGTSVMEMSHRSKEFTSIIEQAEADCRAVYGVPDNYKVLFLQGGASLQFTMLAMNLMHGEADYVTTGSWGKKAIASAKLHGTANNVYDAKEFNYDRCPDLNSLDYSDSASFVHFTMNETIQGVDYGADPSIGKDLVCDMSSNIGCRPFDVSKYAMIYAGAQKNLGPAGTTLVILREDLLDRIPENLPPMLDYKVQADSGSLYNTPPCWAIYMCGLVFKHLLSLGGLEAVEKNNRAKADLLYSAIDNSNGFYGGHAQLPFRSTMNVPFVLTNDDLTGEFIKEAGENGMIQLKGHRSVGGCRASIYNAFPIDGVEALAQFMGDFAQRNS
jgi:phosphoserine aminotransferase